MTITPSSKLTQCGNICYRSNMFPKLFVIDRTEWKRRTLKKQEDKKCKYELTLYVHFYIFV